MVAQLQSTDTLKYILAGNSIFTLKSLKTSKHLTYKVKKADDKDLWFVSALVGPNNEADYVYLGVIENSRFRLTAKSKAKPDSDSVKAIIWTIGRIAKGDNTPNMEIWHEGRCGKCGRLLTTPESIEIGIGPECLKKVGM